MGYKILIDPYHLLSPVQEWMLRKNDLDFLNLNQALARYKSAGWKNSHEISQYIAFPERIFSGFPLWFKKHADLFEKIVNESKVKQSRQYIPSIQALDQCLQDENVSLILLWNDHTAWTKALTYLGRKHDVPSLVVSHGIPGQIPVHGKVWADKIAVFGDSSRQFYLSNGNSEEKIVITGNPHWDSFKPCSNEKLHKIKKELQLPSHKKTIMYAPTWYHNFGNADNPEQYLIRDLKIVLAGIKNLSAYDNIELVVKLHPGQKEKWGFYDKALREEAISFKLFTNKSPLQLIQVSDVVICSGSMAVEAMLVGIPLIHLFNPEPNFATSDMAPFDIVFYEDEMIEALDRILKEGSEYLDGEIKSFLHRVNGRCDGKATERVANLALQMARESKSKRHMKEFVSPVSYSKHETYFSNIRQDIPAMITGKPQRILEVGCAEGGMGQLIKKEIGCEYVGLEIKKEACLEAQKRLDLVIHGDVEKTKLNEFGLAERSFDYRACA